MFCNIYLGQIVSLHEIHKFEDNGIAIRLMIRMSVNAIVLATFSGCLLVFFGSCGKTLTHCHSISFLKVYATFGQNLLYFCCLVSQIVACLTAKVRDGRVDLRRFSQSLNSAGSIRPQQRPV